MYDAIIVGARCAGSPTGMLLAREGYRVLVVDRARFPSDTMSTHAIHPPGVARLKRWGLLDRVIASGCAAFRSFTLDLGPLTLRGCPTPIDGTAEHYAPRRTVLDEILVDAAVEAGAEVRERFTVRELLVDGRRVAGIRGGAPGGAQVSERARIVIGADGLHSMVAKAVDAPSYNAKPSLSCMYYSYWSGVPLDEALMCFRPGRMVIAFPTNDDLTLVVILWPRAEFHAVRSDIEGHFVRAAQTCTPELAERMRAGTREERFVGTGSVPNFFRRPYGPGWALVGDAGYHKDPIGAHGIMDAFHDAERLARAIDAGLSGRTPLDQGLARYEMNRNAAGTALYEFNAQLATLQPPPPDLQRLFAALAANQAETDRFFGAFFGTVPMAEFLSPDNLERILATAELARATA